jgi:hypothetical protein
MSNIDLSDVCYSAPSVFECADLQFSPDGRYLGFRYGGDGCGRELRILDVLTNDIVFESEYGSNHWFHFLPSNQVIMAFGHCEGGVVYILDPQSGQITDLGSESIEGVLWNQPMTAAVSLSHAYATLDGYLWAYSLRTKRIFMTDWGVIEQVIWTPNGKSFVYEKLRITRLGDNAFTDGTTYIVIAPVNDTPYTLVSDPRYDYHLCDDFRTGCEWYGDWIKVRRILSTHGAYNTYSDGYDPCLLYGSNCSNPPERFALNYRTGELIPWDQFPLPAPTPTPTFLPTPLIAPDLSQTPIYAHPSGRYAFFVGFDGHSLWLVPQDGEPVLWVDEGYNFTYLP